MWRKETNEDRARKRAEELQKKAPPPINPHPAPQRTPEQARQELEGTTAGAFFDGLDKCCEVFMYVICCCGCCTSWDKYHGTIDFDAPDH